MGVPSVFLRLATCNLACSWCDTKYTWDWQNFDYQTEVVELDRDEVQRRIRAFNCSPLGEVIPELQIGANMIFAPAMRTPSISLYSGMDPAGLPLSVTFDGFSGEDRKLLDVAEAIEKVMPRLAEPKSI